MSFNGSDGDAALGFHLAFPVHDLDAAYDFYVRILGCETGRQSARWMDLNFFGHQITAHLRPEECTGAQTNPVDGDAIPVRHFGAVLNKDAWKALAERLKDEKVTFLLEPRIRYEGRVGEQGTFFVIDPSGNALEFKTVTDAAHLFAKGDPEKGEAAE